MNLILLLSLIGAWQYDGFRFQGQTYPNPNPDLVLIFEFHPDQTSRLFWFRKNESGFCERRGIYRLENDQLWQKTTWVNPENAMSCASDSDMQLDRETRTKFQLSQDDLTFVLELKGEDFFYLLKRTQTVPPIP